MGFPRQGYWSGLQFPSPGVLPNPGMETASPAWMGGWMAGGFLTTESPGKPSNHWTTREFPNDFKNI